MTDHQHLVVMGVAGSGKTTIAGLLAARLGCPFAEGDEQHPPANVAKMAAGVPLTDDDRWPWLRAVRDWMTQQDDAGRDSVVTCSALKRSYRDLLRETPGRVRFVHLDGSFDLIGDRLETRAGHFLPSALSSSQFEILEPLADDEDGVVVPVADSPDRIADDALRRLGMPG